MRKLTENEIVLASHNKGKLKELQETLVSLKLNLLSQSEFDFPEAVGPEINIILDFKSMINLI